MDELRNRWWRAGMVILGVMVFSTGCWRGRDEDRLNPIIFQAAKEYGVAPALIKAVIWRESRFNPGAKGKAGEIGLMQIRAPAAQEWADALKIPAFRHYHLYDPQKNTRAGTWYLSKLLKRYEGTDNPIPYALADYNAGRRNVLRWNEGDAATQSARFLEQIDFPGTKAYIEVVMERYQLYLKRLGDEGRRVGG